jgi:hypothetical protein
MSHPSDGEAEPEAPAPDSANIAAPKNTTPVPADASVRKPDAVDPNSDSGSSASMEPAPPFTTVVPKRGYPVVDRQTPSTFLQDIAKPINASRIAQCYVRREVRGPLAYSVYHLFGYDETPLMIARNKSSISSTQFRLVEPLSGTEVGWIRFDLIGTS